jgi:hypothetical protein
VFIGESVFYADFFVEIFSVVNGDLRFFGLVGNERLDDFFHGAGKGDTGFFVRLFGHGGEYTGFGWEGKAEDKEGDGDPRGGLGIRRADLKFGHYIWKVRCGRGNLGVC